MNGHNVCLHFPATGQWKLICLRAIFNHPGRAEPCSESAPLLRSPHHHHQHSHPPQPFRCWLPHCRGSEWHHSLVSSPFNLLFSCFGCFVLVARHQAQFWGSKVQGGFVGWRQHPLGRLPGVTWRVRHRPHPLTSAVLIHSFHFWFQ